MKALVRQLIYFQKANFHPGLYLSLLVFIGISVGFNFSVDFYDEYIIKGHSPALRWLLVSAFNMFPFLVAALLVYYFRDEKSWVKDP
ncbi:MAG: hypothetical protein RIE59_25530, partial [Imperialibacter sp.]